jgi:hypothetical protein
MEKEREKEREKHAEKGKTSVGAGFPKEKREYKTNEQLKADFENVITQYLESNPMLRKERKVNELEIRFGDDRNPSRKITKIDYDNVVKQLYACGFKCSNTDGLQILRITNQYYDTRLGKNIMSNIRAEVVGADLIQEYCRTNSLRKLIDMPSTVFNKVKFTQKLTAQAKDGSYIQRVNMNDFNFRVSYQLEQEFNTQSQVGLRILDKWTDSKKMFRCLNRVRFRHPKYPIFADLSIVKSSRKTGNNVIPEYTIQEAGVFNNIEQYEIELEVDNERVGMGTAFNTTADLMEALRKCIRMVLMGLQGSKFPIPYSEQDEILREYMKLIHGEDIDKEDKDAQKEFEKEYNKEDSLEEGEIREKKEGLVKPEEEKEKTEEEKERTQRALKRRVRTTDFIGPSSLTLQIKNIIEPNDKINVPNIRRNYCVTEKADGERKLLYIADDGKLYLIDTNMSVIFTGARTSEKTIFNSLLDGEHIKYDKNSAFINLYAAFDIYYIRKRSVRDFAFDSNSEEESEEYFRLHLLKHLVSIMKPISILDTPSGKREVDAKQTISSGFRIQCKTFYKDSPTISIFNCCSKIISNEADGVYEYNTDGIIFTPTDLPVAATRKGEAGSIYKPTWDRSFKWKPPQYNTIDFLVSIKKDEKTGKDEIHHIFQDGRNMMGVQEVRQYKTLVLRCGFDEKRDGYLNPFDDVIKDNIKFREQTENEDNYKPVPFQPTNPYDPNACFANIWMKEDGNKMFMLTEEGEYFEENMIVEFSYEKENDDGWKWVPLRVRYDKTAELKAGFKNYGNAYRVANNNWHSIHHPITNRMISTGEEIPEIEPSDDVYYARSGEQTSTQSLRDFHNLYVKKKLITGPANKGDTLIDYAVGKAGDLSKWIHANLKFVFGIDVSKDNIHNNIDGACSRYLHKRKEYKDMPRALFVVGNSSLNIRSGLAFATEKDKQIADAVFGVGPKDVTQLGQGVFNQYGKGEAGFNISSCQFAMHYFFENKTTFHQFIRNLAECTKINGYFVSTCYDGKTAFDLLKGQSKGESVTIMKGERKIYEITKMYDQTGFPDDEMSLGYPINVYQESINQTLREYLVNYEYFKEIMENYGFVLVEKEEARRMDLPSGSGLFSELYKHMENEIKRNPKKEVDYGTALNITAEERRISFMNRYFVFKKVRSLDAKKMSEIILKQNLVAEERDEETMKELIGSISEQGQAVATMPLVMAKKNKKPKMVLKAFQPITEDEGEAGTEAGPVAGTEAGTEAGTVAGTVAGTEQPIKPKRKLVIRAE